LFILHPDISYPSTGHLLFDFVIEKAVDQFTGIPNFVEKLREQTRNFNSVYELLGDRYYLDHSKLDKWIIYHEGHYHKTPVFTDKDTYLDYPNLKWCFKDTAMHDKTKDAMQFKEDIQYTDPNPDHDLIIYSESETTEDQITFQNKRGTLKFTDIRAEKPLNGDGTVPEASAQKFLNAKTTVSVKGNHSLVPNTDETFLELVKFYSL
jgi:hypothetical protein